MIQTPGDYTFFLEHDGRKRSCIIHAPPAINAGHALALVLNFHGGGGNAKGYMQYTKMNALADKEGFIVVYPDGTGERENKFLSWNAGKCCGYAFDNNVNDVGFIKRLIEQLPDWVRVDERRVYSTGISNGAMMTYRLASELPNKIAAFAAVAGGTIIDTIASEEPVPIMHIHSLDDPRALYNGGVGPHFPMTKQGVNHPDIEKMLQVWLEHNHCDKNPVIGPTVRKKQLASGDEHGATKYTYSSAQHGTQIVVWKLTGAGHVWPGGLADYLEDFLGASTDVIDANKEIWDFFSGYKREN